MGFSLSGITDFVSSAINNPILNPVGALTQFATGMTPTQQLATGASIASGGSLSAFVGPPAPPAPAPAPVSFGGFAQQVLTDVGIPYLQQTLLPGGPTAGAAVMPTPTATPTATPAMGPAIAGVATTVRMILAKASAWIGKRVTRSSLMSAVKKIGLEATAVALGLTVFEVATVVASAPTRRARGISAGDVKRTKRTLRKLSSLACNFNEYCTTSKSLPRRKKVCR